MPSFLKPLELSVPTIERIVDRMERADWAMDNVDKDESRLKKGLGLLANIDLFLNLGDGAGVYLISSLRVGRSAEVSMIIWRRDWLRRPRECREALDWTMEAFNLLRLVGYVSVTNILAIRFDERLGMRRVGRLDNWFVRNGQPRSAYMYELVKGGSST
jgi:hypothetical protein